MRMARHSQEGVGPTRVRLSCLAGGGARGVVASRRLTHPGPGRRGRGRGGSDPRGVFDLRGAEAMAENQSRCWRSCAPCRCCCPCRCPHQHPCWSCRGWWQRSCRPRRNDCDVDRIGEDHAGAGLVNTGLWNHAGQRQNAAPLARHPIDLCQRRCPLAGNRPHPGDIQRKNARGRMSKRCP